MHAESEDFANVDKIHNLKQDYEVALLNEEIFFKQLSRNKWLAEGDKNTKFFHHSLISRQSKLVIPAIKVDDRILHDPKDIVKAAVNYFNSQLSATSGLSNDSLLDCIPNLVL